MMFHTKAWGVWLIAALAPFLLTKNPFYLLLAILLVSINYAALARHHPARQPWTLLLQLGLVFAAISILFNVLWVSAGATRLATLPALRFTFGQSVVQIGGAITLESITYGLTQALALFGILIALATFNLGVDHYALLRNAPRFLYQSALVLSIGVTFIPQMLVAQREIREAQMLRGHRFHALRDLPPLFVVLLAEGLERSITLAESMSARGLGGQYVYTPRATTVLQTLIALALFALIVGAVALNYLDEKIIGALSVAFGGGVLLAVVWSIRQRVPCSRYRRERWRARDTVLVGAAVSVLALFFGAAIFDRAALMFYPYPRVTMPPFNPILAFALLGLGVPAWSARKAQSND